MKMLQHSSNAALQTMQVLQWSKNEMLGFYKSFGPLHKYKISKAFSDF